MHGPRHNSRRQRLCLQARLRGRQGPGPQQVRRYVQGSKALENVCGILPLRFFCVGICAQVSIGGSKQGRPLELRTLEAASAHKRIAHRTIFLSLHSFFPFFA